MRGKDDETDPLLFKGGDDMLVSSGEIERWSDMQLRTCALLSERINRTNGAARSSWGGNSGVLVSLSSSPLKFRVLRRDVMEDDAPAEGAEGVSKPGLGNTMNRQRKNKGQTLRHGQN